MATLDTTTAGEYSALYNASDRASLIVSAISGTVTVNVYDGTDTVVGTGTMASPWATAVDDTVVIGSVNGFAVTSTGTPDDNWYLRFVSGSRYVQFTFGLLGSGKEAVWSRSDWTAGTQAGIRNSVITVSGNVPPVFSVAPTSASLSSSGGTIQFTATDANDDTLTYSLPSKYLSSIYINSATGEVRVPASAAGTSGNITVRASDGTLTTDATCAVTVAAATTSTPDFIIPSSVSTWNAAASQPRVSGGTAVPNNVSNPIIELSAGTSTTSSSGGTRGKLTISNLNPSTGTATVRNPSGATVTISGSSGFIFLFDGTPEDILVDGTHGGTTYGIVVEASSSTAAPTALFKVKGQCKRVRVQGLDCDGKRTSFVSAVTPTGIDFNDSAMTWGSNQWREDITIDRCRVRRVAGEGMYVGPNFSAGGMPFKNVAITDCIVEDTGRDGINVKGWWAGVNEISGCRVTRAGRNTADENGQCTGIAIMSSVADAHDNIVTDSGEHGILWTIQNGPVYNVAPADGSYGAFTNWEVRGYNNVVVNAGVLGKTSYGDGMRVGQATAGCVTRTPYFYNNTVVNSLSAGLNAAAGSVNGWFRNNVLVGNGSAYSLGTGTTQAYNTTSATLTADYRLTSEIAATGSIGTDISATDIEGTSRAGTASRGAYEYA